MEWLAILALGALLWAQSARVGALTRKLEALERKLPPEPKPLPAREVAGAPGEELEPLLLDTPLPEPSNDTDDTPPLPPMAKPASAIATGTAGSPGKPSPSLPEVLWPIDGQALTVLAVLVALLAPQFTSRTLWPPTGLTIYLASVAAAGFAIAAWRRWAWAAVVTALGLYFWFAAAIAADDLRRALTMVSLAALGGVSLAFREPEMEAAATQLPWSRLRAELPTATLCASSVLMLWAWVAIADTGSGSVARVAWVGTMLVALAAATVRTRIAAAASFAVAAATLTLGFAAYLALRAELLRPGADFYPFILFSALTVALAAMFARPHRDGRAMIAASGAIGAAVLVALAAFSRQNWHGPAAWALLFATAALLAALAHLSARNELEEKRNLAVGAWAGASAALLFLGVESAFPASLRAPAYVGASLVIVAGLTWRGWAILGYAALASAALAIAYTLSAPSHGPAEAAGYALIFLSAPLALAEVARRRAGASPELDEIIRAATWLGLGGASLLILAARHPWWGAQDAAASGDVATALAVMAQAAAAALAFLLAREFSRRDPRARFATCCTAALFALSFGHCAIRWMYQRGAMDDRAGFVGIEGLAHALWPLALVLMAGIFTPRSDRPHWRDLRRIVEHAIWPALGFAALGMWVLFSPWWGLVPVHIGSPLTALLALLAYVAAARMSYATRGIPYIAGAIWFAKARTLATIGHLLVAATLGVRWGIHREAIAQAPVGNLEMWLYSAILAAFGTRTYWLGLRRGAKYLRGAGLALLLIAAAKVLLVDLSELPGVVRIGLLAGLAALWLAIAWARRGASARA